MWLHRRASWLIVLLGISLFIGIRYGAVVIAPNDHLFADSGDGIKNYYTLLYHVRHDTEAFAFSGMNHPFGEHVFYTDGHPLLSWVLQGLSRAWPSVVDHGVGILNLMMVLALAVCALALHGIGLGFGIRPVVSALAVIGITILAPQWSRMTGHFGLSYGCFLPVTWWLITRIGASANWRSWSAMFVIAQLIWWLTHPYLGAMAGAFAGLIAGFAGWSSRNDKEQRVRWSLVLLLGAVLPVLVFKGILSATDDHVGRAVHPSGFFGYTAEPDDLLLPTKPPLRPVIEAWFPGVIHQQWEALAYIGIGTVCVLLAWPFVRFGRRRREARERIPIILRASLLASVVLLVFAFCIPFKDFPETLRFLPILEQFRATGRFTWPFFFSITIWAVWSLDRWSQGSQSDRARTWHAVLCVVLPISFMVEGWHGHDHAASLSNTPNRFLSEGSGPATRAVFADPRVVEAQAILPMPYFNFGSESFTRPSLDGITRAALYASYHTGLPIAGSILSRVSVPESRKLTQLISPSFYTKLIAADLPDNRPFLIVRSQEELSPDELAIVAKATPLDTADGVIYYVLAKDALLRSTACEERDRLVALRPSFHPKGSYLLSDSAAGIIAAFDGVSDAYSGPKLGEHTVLDTMLPGARPGDRWVLGVWMDNSEEGALNLGLQLIVEQYGPDGVHEDRTLPNESAVIDGMRTFAELPFTVLSTYARVKVKTRWRGHFARTLRMDHLLIRPERVQVLRFEQDPGGSGEVAWHDGHRIVCLR